VSDYTEGLYEEFIDYKNYFMNSVNAIMDVEEEQKDVIIDIRDILKQSNNLTNDNMKKEGEINTTGASIKGAFKNIDELFKNQLKSLFKDFNKMFGDISGIKDAPTTEFTQFLYDFMKGITMDGEYKDPAKLAKLYESLGKGINLIGESIIPMSKGLILFNLAAKTKGPEKFVDYIDKLLTKDLLKNVDAKKLKKDSEAIEALAKGIFNFGLYMSLSAPLLLLGIPAAIVAIPIIVGMTALMSLVTKRSKDIKRGAKAIKDLSIGLLLFSGSLAVISMIDVDYGKVALTLGLFLGFTTIITLISKIGGKKDMKDAAIAVAILSGALAVFALSTMLFEDLSWKSLAKAGASLVLLSLITLIMSENKSGVIFAGIGVAIVAGALYLLGITVAEYEDIKWETLAKVGAILAVVAILTYYMGMFPEEIILAGIGIAIVSASIFLLSLSMQTFKELEWKDVGKFAATIGVLALAITLLGNPEALIGGAILAGVALAVAGSLYIITAAFENIISSLDRFKKLGWSKEDSESLGAMFSGIINGMIKPFASDSILGSIGKMYAGFAGSSMTLIVSLAIGNIVDALQHFKDSGLTENDTDTLGSVIKGTINGVLSPFQSKGLFDFVGKIIGGATGTGMLAVISLTIGRIVDALAEFNKQKLTEDDAKEMGKVISAIITNVKGSMEEIGKTDSWWGDSDFENGLESFGSFGKALTNIAEGIKSMAHMTFIDPETGKSIVITPVMVTQVGNNIKTLLNAIKIPIMDIGATTGTGPFGNAIFAETTFEDGMEAVMGTGKMLGDIAKGVKEVMSLRFTDSDGKSVQLKESDFDLVGNKVSSVITAISDPITKIGKKGILRITSSFQRGITSANMASGMLANVAKGVKDVLKLKFIDSDGNSITLEDADFETVGTKVSDVITAISKPISKIGETGFWGGKSNFRKGIASANIAANMIGEVAKGVKNILELKFFDKDGKKINFKDSDFELVGDKVSDVLTAISSPISEIGKDNFQKGTEAIDLASGMITNISKSVQAMLEFKSESGDLNDYEERSIVFTNMLAGIGQLGDKKDEIVEASKAVVSMNNSGIKLIQVINKASSNKMDATKKLFESLVQLDNFESSIFEKKLKAVENLIEKTDEISDKTKSFAKAIKPEASDEMKQLVVLMNTLLDQQKQLNSSIQAMNTSLKGVLRVENVD